MQGIDISNYQNGLVPNAHPINFCIAKATEGLGYVDNCCDTFIQNCINSSIKWGFYHFARNNEPEREAEFFYDACKNYFGHGIPVLDYEVTNFNNRVWCERFIKRLHDLSGIWCLLYISASRCGEYEGSWIPDKCGLWVAGYPMAYTEWTNDPMPYNTYPFRTVAIWQFTNQLTLNGWSVDADIAYMDESAWDKYAIGESATPMKKKKRKKKNIDELACEVIDGKWGNGWNRKQALDSAFGAGIYDKVQCRVNELLSLDGC